jgi:hypothetical protein
MTTPHYGTGRTRQLCIILSVNSLAAAGWMVCWATDLARSAKSVAQQTAQIMLP